MRDRSRGRTPIVIQCSHIRSCLAYDNSCHIWLCRDLKVIVKSSSCITTTTRANIVNGSGECLGSIYDGGGATRRWGISGEIGNLFRGRASSIIVSIRWTIGFTVPFKIGCRIFDINKISCITGVFDRIASTTCSIDGRSIRFTTSEKSM